MSFLSKIREYAQGKDLKKSKTDTVRKSSLLVLNSVSFSLAAVSILFLIAFNINGSVSLSWFFLCEAVAFILIPVLARMGYPNATRLLLLSYVNIAIIVLSAVLGMQAQLQVFFIPAIGLAILLFDSEHIFFRSVGIGISVVSYFILDYVIFDHLYLTDERFWILKWAVLTAAFICTWLVFNKFSDLKENAESEIEGLLEESRELNKALLKRKEELQNHIEELEKAKERAEEGAKVKSKFLSTISHELRTPLNAIVGISNSLDEEGAVAVKEESIEILKSSAQDLKNMVEELLDFSKIDSGDVKFKKKPFDLLKLLHRLFEKYEGMANTKGLDIELKGLENISGKIMGDHKRLYQILENILHNALKYTDSGSVELATVVEKDSDEYVDLCFVVRDTGMGIDEQDKEHIFETFSSGNIKLNEFTPGTGLGLAMTRQLVELQNGEITFISKTGEGSTFKVYLTFQKYREAAKKVNKSQSKFDGSTLRGAKVLLVEDNVINQKVAGRFLNLWDVKVTIAENGNEALEELDHEDFDLILMDLQMPEMDGYEATGYIRKLPDDHKSQIPIVALTASALQEVKEKVWNAGMNDFISKPFQPEELRLVLLRNLVKEPTV